MDDPGRRGTGFAEGLDVGHHVMAKLTLILRDPLVIDIVKVGPHLLELGFTDVETQLGL